MVSLHDIPSDEALTYNKLQHATIQNASGSTARGWGSLKVSKDKNSIAGLPDRKFSSVLIKSSALFCLKPTTWVIWMRLP